MKTLGARVKSLGKVSEIQSLREVSEPIYKVSEPVLKVSKITLKLSELEKK